MLFSFVRKGRVAQCKAPEQVEPTLTTSQAPTDTNTSEGNKFAPKSRTELMRENAEVLNRLKLCYGRETPQFERDILTIVERYADFVNALPATASNYFAYPGGLFRLGLYIAFFALQATDAQIFEGRSTISQRRHLEPRWRQAAFIAGLCVALQPLLNTVAVCAPDGQRWPSYLRPLSTWLERYRGASLRLVWSSAPRVDGLQNLYALAHIIPAATLEHLADQNDVVVPALLAALARLPLPGCPDSMTALVRRAAALVIHKELRRLAATRGAPVEGEHLARLLIDIMHDLVHSAATWMPNADRSRIWHAQDGTFVVWPGACQDICAHADHEQLHGVPRDPDKLLAALRGAGVIDSAGTDCIHHIQPPSSGAPVACLRITVPELVLANHLFTCRPLAPVGVDLTPAPDSSVDDIPTSATEPEGDDSDCKRPVCPDQERQLQLALVSESEADVTATPTAPRRDKPTKKRKPAGQLSKSFRLPADVAAVIENAIETLGESGRSSAAVAVAEGVLIPLQTFKDSDIDPRRAIRNLREAGMLFVDETDNPVRSVPIDGGQLLGIVVKRELLRDTHPPQKTDEVGDASASV